LIDDFGSKAKNAITLAGLAEDANWKTPKHYLISNELLHRVLAPVK